MNISNRKALFNETRFSSGFSLIEILIAIVVFAIGMMALAQFQGSLTRSNAAAMQRTTAINMAEEIIEDQQGFISMGSDPSNDFPSYEDLGKNWSACPETYRLAESSTCRTTTAEREGVSMGVTEMVTDFYHDFDNTSAADDGFSGSNTLDKYYSDFKVYSLQITWMPTGSPDWWLSDTQAVSAGDLNAEVISVSTILKSSASQTSAVVVTQESNGQISPLKPYSPGLRPDVVGLDLGDNRFKESLTPMPDVTSVDEYVETNFDVITYSQTGDSSIFLRLENFKSVTCQCVLGDAAGNLTGEGRRPTVWAADQYEDGELMTKVVGSEANNNQSPYCDVCCRDHHDGGAGTSEDSSDSGRYQYNPWRPAANYHSSGTLNGDHKHFSRTNRGDLSTTPATAAGHEYEESCRMVRVNGFWRLAHDFRRENMLVFPEGYFASSTNATTYSTYVTEGVADLVQAIDETDEYYYQTTQSTMPAPVAGTFPTETVLTTDASGTDQQQLRSRGIYLDFMSKELRDVLDCLDPERGNGSAATCSNLTDNSIELEVIGSENFLEAVPFFDVQTTWLARWTEEPNGTPIDVSNEALADNNAHSRGIASLTGGTGTSVISVSSHTGNLGFTDTDPIDHEFNANLTTASIDVEASNTAQPPPAGTDIVSGEIYSGVNGLQASRVDFAFVSDAICNRTNTGYICTINGPSPEMILSGYFKSNKVTVACSEPTPAGTGGPVMTIQQNNTNANDPRAIVDLSTGDTTGTWSNDIWIRENNCN